MSFSLSKIISSTWLQTGSKSLMIVALLAAVLLPIAQPVAAETGIPTFVIIDVVKDTTVTIETSNFPAEETFTVYMGPIGSLGINGIEVATTETGAGGTLELTFDIPEDLKGAEMIAIRLESESGYYSYNWFANADPAAADAEAVEETPAPTPEATQAPAETEEPVVTAPAYSGIPSFTITAVDPGKSVTVSAVNFPANVDFNVLMGLYGTWALGGVEAGTANSGDTGAFEATFTIPESMAGESAIAIRMDSSDGYYYSYNWFFNTATTVEITEAAAEETAATPAPEATPTAVAGEVDNGYEGVPGFSVVHVEGGLNVTIKPENLPLNDTFTVLMGAFGTRGIDGVEVGTILAESEDFKDQTFTIPEELADANILAIRLESESGFYAYNWFFNVTTPIEEAAYSGIPTISIVSVVKNETVTIKTSNFPPNLDFAVRLGDF
ncbi:MAG: hypothetical protein AAGU05_00280, partial [Anaerolineaceae bacterium]